MLKAWNGENFDLWQSICKWRAVLCPDYSFSKFEIIKQNRL